MPPSKSEAVVPPYESSRAPTEMQTTFSSSSKLCSFSQRPGVSSTIMIQSSSGSTSTRGPEISPPSAHNSIPVLSVSSQSKPMATFGTNHFSRPRRPPDEVGLFLANLGHPYSVMKLIKGKNITTRDGLLAELRKEVNRIRSDVGLGPWQEDYTTSRSESTENNRGSTVASSVNEQLQIGAVRLGYIATTPTKRFNIDEGIEACGGELITRPKSATTNEHTVLLDKFKKVSPESVARGSLQLRRMHNVCLLDLGDLPVLEHA